jgi:molybdenum cofactor cytidylyltransferase
MHFALLPAGGHSQRMGRPKLLLPLGGRTVLEHAVSAMREAGVDRVLAIAAAHLPELVEVAERAGASAVTLPGPTPDMRATVQFGLDWVADHWRPADGDGWFLVPADHPLVTPAVVRALTQAWHRRDPGTSIFVPTHAGRRGHPVLIGWPHAAALRAFPPNHGINAYLRTQQAHTVEVPVTEDDILTDLDTPEDYERLQARFKNVESRQGEH